MSIAQRVDAANCVPCPKCTAAMVLRQIALRDAGYIHIFECHSCDHLQTFDKAHDRRAGANGVIRIGTRVSFIEPFRPAQVVPGAVGVVVLIEPLPPVFGPPPRLLVKFGEYVTPWVMQSQLKAVSASPEA
jgi:hypothetical protein